MDHNVKDRFEEGGYMHEKLTKAARGLRAYEQVSSRSYYVDLCLAPPDLCYAMIGTLGPVGGSI